VDAALSRVNAQSNSAERHERLMRSAALPRKATII
jgi:hypothetical protein